MASIRSKTTPVGSAAWIANEREQASLFIEQEVEEFGYSVRNELEWLNEHMGEVLSRGPVYEPPLPPLICLPLTSILLQQPHRRIQDSREASRQNAAYSAQTRCGWRSTTAHRHLCTKCSCTAIHSEDTVS